MHCLANFTVVSSQGDKQDAALQGVGVQAFELIGSGSQRQGYYQHRHYQQGFNQEGYYQQGYYQKGYRQHLAVSS